MNREEVVWIPPDLSTINPNVPLETRYIQLAPIELVPWSALSSVLVLETELDIGKLKTAIAALLGWYPSLTSGYVSHKRTESGLPEYAIQLKGVPIPLFLAQSASIQQYPFPTSDVVQPSLDTYSPSLRAGSDKADADVPLIAFKHTLSLPYKRSILGVTIPHTLINAASCSKLLHDLARLYCHPELPLQEPPEYFRHVMYPVWPPTEETKREFRSDLLMPEDRETIMRNYTTAMSECESVTLRPTVQDLDVLQERAEKSMGGTVSKQDAPSGWWIDFLERLGEEEITTLTYMINAN